MSSLFENKPKTPEVMLQKAHIAILKDRRTYAIGATVLMGESKLCGPERCPTACTDGRNKYYNKEFITGMNLKELVYLSLHENFHVLMMDTVLLKDLWEEDPCIANAAMDYCNNGMIEGLGIDDMIQRPEGALIDPMFNGWDTRRIYRFLRKGKKQFEEMMGDGDEGDAGDEEGDGEAGQDGDGAGREGPLGKGKGSKKGSGADAQEGDQGETGQGDSGVGGKPSSDVPGKKGRRAVSVTVDGKKYDLTPMDEHGFDKLKTLSKEQVEELRGEIRRAVEQASLFAGVGGGKIPQQLKDAHAPKVDWKEELSEFLNSALAGDDDITFRKYDRRFVTEEIYMPTMFSERMGTMIFCMDTSGSTCGPVLDSFVAGFQQVLNACRPEKVRILHWDHGVRHDQTVEEGEYLGADLKELLTPIGGGGTHVSSVGEYIAHHNIEGDCILVFTDGYVEGNVSWRPRQPTLWLITENEGFIPPVGRIVKIKE